MKAPDWVLNYPQTPLNQRLYGVRYPHLLYCSGNYQKPIGSPGCLCLRVLRKECEEGVGSDYDIWVKVLREENGKM